MTERRDDQLGLRRDVRPGAGRLLRALVMAGLDRDAVPAAAVLVDAMDRAAAARDRVRQERVA